MIRKFGRDRRGNYTLMTVITMVPLMGGLALSVDYSELLRQKNATLNALDGAGLATAAGQRGARRIATEQLCSGPLHSSAVSAALAYIGRRSGCARSGSTTLR
ncbi:TadE/TadG family type IV pilus assembly protein [Mesorhizobium sp.]|uniref:TadE/TadG family type IV pilus assembly protein n=1 Tax=Mesorhizobium sp. TaxID=1871066 RepID=UPI0025BBC591|nr:TadE/TadG family type IV pilus assembly protein [Mesorhizobium sp.]